MQWRPAGQAGQEEPPQSTSVSLLSSKPFTQDTDVGAALGNELGADVGLAEGSDVGVDDGASLGSAVGEGDGMGVGTVVGAFVTQMLSILQIPVPTQSWSSEQPKPESQLLQLPPQSVSVSSPLNSPSSHSAEDGAIDGDEDGNGDG
jgi:hypothetical protein